MTIGSASVHTNISREFRSKDGNQISDPQAGLRPRLEDFALKAYADGDASLNDEVFISAHDLFTYLNAAEQGDLATRASSEYRAIDPGTRKRARESTPPPRGCKAIPRLNLTTLPTMTVQDHSVRAAVLDHVLGQVVGFATKSERS